MPTFVMHNPRSLGPIGGYELNSGAGDRYQPFCSDYSVYNKNGKGFLSLYAYDMWSLPDCMKVESEIGQVPRNMKFYMDYRGDMLPRVLDCGIDKTEKGDLAWFVVDEGKREHEQSVYLYASMRSRWGMLYAKDLLNALVSFIPEVESIEDYFQGGGVYDLGPAALNVEIHDGVATRMRLAHAHFASCPNQNRFCPNYHWALGLAPETRSNHYDKRADVFSLARSLGFWEHGNLLRDWNGLRELPFEEALRLSCEAQIKAGLKDIRTEVLEKALAFNPDDRYQSLSEFFEDLVS